ncbi:hypothetical protein [Conexibacter sp. SYSU D00693]|uniref:hypothetical protein n=1 Tax=Conexibacter sp. SYSU D00693 TaxID=2812560 RepID=UPI00196A4AD2|nr:hypothetical protein [Conexibacter sp. SYSU D00693]
MTHRLLALAAATLAGCAAVAPAAPAAPAAETVQFQQTATYRCGSLNGLSFETVDLTVRLDAPRTAAPGDAVAASGTVQVSFSSRANGLVGLVTLARTVRFEADALGLPLRVRTPARAVERTVPLRDVRSEPAPAPGLGRPLRATLPFTLASIVVPADATGDLELRLPANGTAVDLAGQRAAFTGVLLFDGGLDARLPVSCTLPEDGSPVLVRLPLQTAAGAPAPAEPAPATAGEDRAGSADDDDDRDLASGASQPAGDRSADPPRGSSTATGPASSAGRRSTTTAPAGATAGATATSPAVTDAPAEVVWDAVPAATRSDDVFVPAWVLAVLLGFAVAACVATALATRRRLRAARRPEGTS